MSCKNINARQVVTIRKGPQGNKSCGVAMAVQRWRNFEEIPHVQGQRRSPSKTVGGAKSCLESTPDPTEMLRGLKHTLCAPGLRDPTETETELCLSVCCGGMGQQWTATGAGALDAVDLGMA